MLASKTALAEGLGFRKALEAGVRLGSERELSDILACLHCSWKGIVVAIDQLSPSNSPNIKATQFLGRIVWRRSSLISAANATRRP